MGNKAVRPRRKRNQSANHFEESEDLDQATDQKLFFTSSPKSNLIRKRMQRNSINDPRDIIKTFDQSNHSPLPAKKPLKDDPLKESPKEPSFSSNLQNSEMTKTSKNSEVPSFNSNILDSLDINVKIEETKAKIRECDEEIKNLECGPSSSTSNKLLCVSKLRRDQLNKFADQLILKQYYLDKSKFETSLPLREEVEKQQVVNVRARSKTPTFRDILRQQRKSQVMIQKVGVLTEKLTGNQFDADERRNRHQVSQVVSKTSGLTVKTEDQDKLEGKDQPGQVSVKDEPNSLRFYPTLSPMSSPSNDAKQCLTSRPVSKPHNFPLFPSPKSLKNSSSIPWYLKGTDYDKRANP